MLASAMANTLQHRGPDDGGIWVDESAGLALGHRRLAIVDLSTAGHQPMLSPGERFVVVFNGEIYNFRELQQELRRRGHGFRGHSDTEVLLAATCEWGLAGAIERCVGMFAFALWDRTERLLHLCRDRLGEKPLYYGWCGSTFLFGSELKALRVHPDWNSEVDPDAVTSFLRYSYVPAPHSIYRGIRKLLPGTTLTIDPSRPGWISDSVPYWSLSAAVNQGLEEAFAGSDAEAVEALDSLLRGAVRKQMVADVPLGAFLSGGVDSSTIVALMQAQSTRPVKTYTIGFHESGYNEAEHAKAVARHLGTEHTELYVTATETLEVIPRLPTLYDEPFADSSQIPTFLLSQLTRQHVAVSLSGDAGDELFGGYVRHLAGPQLWRRLGWMPGPFQRFLGRSLGRIPPRHWDRAADRLGGLLPPSLRQIRPSEKVKKLAAVLEAGRSEAVYSALVSSWAFPQAAVARGNELPTLLSSPADWPPTSDLATQMMYLDALTYLPDDILVKVDRAAMGVGLETRVPFLDHRVVEFAWRLPLSMKIRGGQGKWVLRQVLDRYVPREIIERPKMGFGVPVERWLRGPLRDWAENLLDERRLRNEGFLNPEAIQACWRDHISGRANRGYQLWSVLMFQAWLEAEPRIVTTE